MIAKLEFNLPDDKYEYTLASRAGEMAGFIQDFQKLLRDARKYGDKTSITYEEMESKFHELIHENGVPEEAVYG